MIPNGIASCYFAKLRLGDNISLRAPAGVFTLHQSPRDKVFLATGTGIAPIKSQLVSFFKRHAYTSLAGQGQPKFQLFWGVRKRADVYFMDELINLHRLHRSFHFKICLSQEVQLTGFDEGYFGLGRITQHLDGYLTPGRFDYYLCGAPQVVASVTEYLKSRGVADENIFCEKF